MVPVLQTCLITMQTNTSERLSNWLRDTISKSMIHDYNEVTTELSE